MRTMMIAMLTAAGLGLAGISGAAAAPASGGVLDTLSAGSMVQKAYVVIVKKRHRHRHCRTYEVCNSYGVCRLKTRCWY